MQTGRLVVAPNDKSPGSADNETGYMGAYAMCTYHVHMLTDNSAFHAVFVMFNVCACVCFAITQPHKIEANNFRPTAHASKFNGILAKCRGNKKKTHSQQQATAHIVMCPIILGV